MILYEYFLHSVLDHKLLSLISYLFKIGTLISTCPDTQEDDSRGTIAIVNRILMV